MARSRRRVYDVVITRGVLGIDERRPQRRRRAHWRSRWVPRARMLSFLLLIALSAGLTHLLASPVYTVRRVTVRGNRLISAQAVYQASGIAGQNVMLLNTEAAAKAVERLPQIRHATIHVRLPAEVAIAVEEYQPQWNWVSGEHRFWIDEAGHVLPPSGPLTGALTVIDTSGQPLAVGSRLDPKLIEILELFDQLLPEVTELTYHKDFGFVLRTDQGWPVRLGDTPDEFVAKIVILEALIPDLVSRGADVNFIDLRYPERPYYRLNHSRPDR